MKNLFIILILICTACKSNTKETPQRIEEIVEKVNVEPTSVEMEATNPNKVEFNLLETVLKNLNLTKAQCKEGLIATKLNPINLAETIMAIPEILKVEDDETYFEYKMHILIANTLTGEIEYQFDTTNEDSVTSDAVSLLKIKIDTAVYLLAASQRAFGIRLYFANNSQPNPYSYEAISLYLQKDKALVRVLKEYEVMSYHGETDTTCYGDFVETKTVLIVTETYTNGFLNILTNSNITETKNRPDENDECVYTKTTSSSKKILKFNGKVYK